MSDFNIARKNMIHNQLMTNNIVEDHILKAFNAIPKRFYSKNSPDKNCCKHFNDITPCSRIKIGECILYKNKM